MPHVLAFFAHPDDETLSAGALLAHLALRYEVHLVTATRGELGESAPGVLNNPTRDQFVAYRERELQRAAAALGAVSYTFLDRFGAGSVTDSGMKWADETHTRAIADPTADQATAFSLGDLEEQAQALARAIDYYRPQLLLTEEPGGGYGHPDHVRCHQVAARAVQIASHQVEFVAWSVIEEESLRADLAELAESSKGLVLDPAGPLPSQVVPAGHIHVAVDALPYRRRVLTALRGHATQIPALGRTRKVAWYKLTDEIKRAVPKRVGYVLAPHPSEASEVSDSVELAQTGPTTHSLGVEQFAEFVNAPLRDAPRWYLNTMTVMAGLIGLITGALGTITHRTILGLVVALIAVAAGGFLARAMAGFRGSLVFWFANAGAILMLTYIRPGADVLVTTDWISTTWLLAGIVLGIVGFTVPKKWLRE